MENYKLQKKPERFKKRAAVHYIIDNNKRIVYLSFAEHPEGVSKLLQGARALDSADIKNLEDLGKE